MQKKTEVALAEWLNTFEQLAAASDGDGMTTREIALAIDRPAQWVREKMLPPLMAAGRVVHGKANRAQINKQVKRVDVYKLLPVAKKKR